MKFCKKVLCNIIDIYFIVYTKDEHGNVTGSNLLQVDIVDKSAPKSRTFRSSLDYSIPRVLYQGDFIKFDDTDPQIINGRTMLPLRNTFNLLGASIEWDNLTQTITSNKEDINISLQVGSKTAYINGQEVILDAEPQVIGGRTLVPLKFIGEAFGNTLVWDGLEKVAMIK
ncbi:MAG: copper amine oxidase N-terminal domain-containing protein [Clostridia bacterium]|nr:copper amine oxidase N-terminal domain-containing protein [Clostridia bacterium]